MGPIQAGGVMHWNLREVLLSIVTIAAIVTAILAGMILVELRNARQESVATLKAVRELHVVMRDVEIATRKAPAAAMWEYKIADPLDMDWSRAMNEEGAEGWEIVSARRASDSGIMGYEMILKRRRQ